MYRGTWGSGYSSGGKGRTVEVSSYICHPGASCAYLALYTGLVADVVEVIRGNSGPDLRSGDVQYFSRQPANLPHSILGLGV